jgi:predicted nucleotidyltransferase component of viral defense system
LISQQELAAWRPYAPWSDDHMVEQDYLISKAVEAIFTDAFLSKQVVMRGGTVLHKGHLAPAARYSEDIDLVLVGDRPPRHIKLALNRVLEPLFGKPQENIFTNVQLTIRNFASKSTIIRQIYGYDPTSEIAARGILKIEVNTNENKPLYDLVTVPVLIPAEGGEPKTMLVPSYDLNEMLGTKLRALLQREHGRDLFDMSWTYYRSQEPESKVQLDPKRVAHAFHYYMAQEGSEFSQAQIESELARRLKSFKFRKDMDGFLADGESYSVDDAHREFCKVFLPHL